MMPHGKKSLACWRGRRSDISWDKVFLRAFGLISQIVIGKDTVGPVGTQRLERALQLFLSRLSFKTTFRENQYFDS